MSDMYSEHRRINPKVSTIRQLAGPGGAVTVTYENGDVDNGDLDELIDNGIELLSRLIALREQNPPLPACAGSELPCEVPR